MDQLIHEEAYPCVSNPLKIVLKRIDRIGVDRVLIQLVPSIDHSFRKEESANV